MRQWKGVLTGLALAIGITGTAAAQNWPFPNRAPHNQYRVGSAFEGQARRFGYEDGLRDGRSDRRSRYSFRPTSDRNYKNATRGYNSSFGNKNAYKAIYRQGYEQGYRAGFGR